MTHDDMHDNAGESADVVGQPDSAAGAAEPTQAPPKARARRRVTRTVTPFPAAAAAELDLGLLTTAEPARAEPTDPHVAEPAATSLAGSLAQLPFAAEPAPPVRRSRRVTRTVVVGKGEPAASPVAEPVEVPAVDTAQVADLAAEPGVIRDEATGDGPEQLDVLAELAGLGPTTPAPSGRLASTALLFQAPEPTARSRRRRVQSQSGPPQEVSASARPVEPVAEPPAEPVTPTASRSGRRRGRGRDAEAAVADLIDAVTDLEEPAEALAADGPDDETDADRPDAQGEGGGRRRRRRGGRGRRARAVDSTGDDPAEDASQEGDPGGEQHPDEVEDDEATAEGGGRRRRRRRRGGRGEGDGEPTRSDEVTALRGSTRLEAKRQRRRDGRDAGRRRQIISEAEFLARRESVDRVMVVRERDGRTQIAVLEDGVLVEHYVSNQAAASTVGNVYLGRVQNVLPSMEAAFVDVGKGRNAVLYAGEVNWDAAGLDGQPRRIEQALKSGDQVLVQVTKDPIGHKGARLTSQVTLAGRYLVLVPGGGMTGISHKLPETERNRLKKILRAVVPEATGVIVRTAAEGASEDELSADIARLQSQWDQISAKARSASAPALLQGEPDMAIRVVRDIFNDDFTSLVVAGEDVWTTISSYIGELAPDLAAKVDRWTGGHDVFGQYRVDEQLAKGMDRKVWLPSGGSLVIDRTEAMTVVDVNTGKFTGVGGTLEETVTRNNLEAAEEIVRQLRLRDIGGMIVVDFIDMVLASNRDLVLRRLVECLGRDRTKHQVAEVTTLGLVQMTRKRVGQGLVEAFSEPCEHCHGRGFIVHTDPVEKNGRPDAGEQSGPLVESASKRSRRKKPASEPVAAPVVPVLPEARESVKATLATIAAAAAHAHEHREEPAGDPDGPELPVDIVPDVLAAPVDEQVGEHEGQFPQV